MPAKAIPSLPKLLYSFFHEWLDRAAQCVSSDGPAYRDAWRLFLFRRGTISEEGDVALLDDLNRVEVAAFLQHLEKTRASSIVTRNCRLAALRSFFGFVPPWNRWRPSNAPRCCRSRSRKRPSGRFAISNRRKSPLFSANRIGLLKASATTHCSLLYNSGARIQEALDLRPEDLHLKSPAHVTLMGKGRKERIAPLWPETAELLTALLRRAPRPPELRCSSTAMVNR